MWEDMPSPLVPCSSSPCTEGDGDYGVPVTEGFVRIKVMHLEQCLITNGAMEELVVVIII